MSTVSLFQNKNIFDLKLLTEFLKIMNISRMPFMSEICKAFQQLKGKTNRKEMYELPDL